MASGEVQTGTILRRHGRVMHDVEEDGRIQKMHVDTLQVEERNLCHIISWQT